MRVKSFLKILIASNSNPFKHSQTSTNTNNLNSNVPELSNNFLNVKTDNRNYNYENNNDDYSDNDSNFVDDENDLKALSTMFGLFYIGQMFYYRSEGLKIERRYIPQFKQPKYKIPTLELNQPSDQVHYINKRIKE